MSTYNRLPPDFNGFIDLNCFFIRSIDLNFFPINNWNLVPCIEY